ncbi:MAG: 4'-phosphopantetheinyl transferase superfamily protein [Chloroflexota bacterium]
MMQLPPVWQPITDADTENWQSIHTIPSLDDSIHIWQFTHDQPNSVVDSLYPMLSVEEKERIQRYYTPQLRARGTVRRGILRYLLGNYLQREPNMLSFSYSEYNKPYLDTERIFFNLSHSEERVLIAICKQDIGVDIEAIKPLPDLMTVAKHHFSPAEQTALFSLSPSEQVIAFYRCWTRKEAFIKADGRGLSVPLDAFDVTLKSDQPARITRIAPSLTNIHTLKWNLHHIGINEQFMGAIAYHGKQRPLRLFLLV